MEIAAFSVSGFGFRISGRGITRHFLHKSRSLLHELEFWFLVSGFRVGGSRAAAEYFLDGDCRVLALDVLFHPLEPLPHLPVLPMEFAQSVAQLLSFP